MPKYFSLARNSILYTLIAVAAVAQNNSLNTDEHHHDLGQVRFPVSCTPEAQKVFERGVALLHSFWYDEAEKTFSQVIPYRSGLRNGLLGHRHEPLSSGVVPAHAG